MSASPWRGRKTHLNVRLSVERPVWARKILSFQTFCVKENVISQPKTIWNCTIFRACGGQLFVGVYGGTQLGGMLATDWVGGQSEPGWGTVMPYGSKLPSDLTARMSLSENSKKKSRICWCTSRTLTWIRTMDSNSELIYGVLTKFERDSRTKIWKIIISLKPKNSPKCPLKIWDSLTQRLFT